MCRASAASQKVLVDSKPCGGSTLGRRGTAHCLRFRSGSFWRARAYIECPTASELRTNTTQCASAAGSLSVVLGHDRMKDGAFQVFLTVPRGTVVMVPASPTPFHPRSV